MVEVYNIIKYGSLSRLSINNGTNHFNKVKNYMSTDNNTQPQEDIKEVETVEEVLEEVSDDTEAQTDSQEETLGDVIGTEEVVEKYTPTQKPKTVPIEVFLELKKELKDLKKDQTHLNLDDSSLEDLAEEFDVDKTFVNKLANAIKNSTVKEFEEQNQKLIRENQVTKDKADRELKFQSLLEKTLDIAPQFKDMVNESAIKQLAYLPENSKKTLSQILEEVYGNSVQGKRTIESSQPSGNREPEVVDFTKAGDPAVYAVIKANPELKKQYFDFVQKNLNL